MPWPEAVRMERAAIVAPQESLRRVLVDVADAGVVEPELLPGRASGPAGEAVQRVGSRRDVAPGDREAVLSEDPPDLAALEREGRLGELTGEAELEGVMRSSVTRGAAAAMVGWVPAHAVEALRQRLRPLGAAVVPLPVPRGSEPPTLLPSEGATRAFQPLVDTYAILPYADVNPALFAGLAYALMFGMMFGDAGHGALLLAGGVLLLAGRPRALAGYRRAAPFVIGAGLASALFGLAYGEAFGPTGIIPTLWLAPLAQPTRLLAAAIGAGAALLAVSYALGTANRWRERGPALALVALSGIAGSALYVGLALVGLGWFRHGSVLMLTGGVLTAAGLVLGFIGLFVESGGRAAGAFEAGIELFDAVVRLGTNTVSFARLAAFGLTHAALGAIVWSATLAIAARGAAWWPLAALLFLVGNAVAFALEALVAGIQALRLEYYELFSRIFIAEGRRFRPWHVPTLVRKEH